MIRNKEMTESRAAYKARLRRERAEELIAKMEETELSFVRSNGWEVDISDAIQMSCEPYGVDGRVEQAAESALMTAKKLGDLIELLYCKGVLQRDEVIDLVTHYDLTERGRK